MYTHSLTPTFSTASLGPLLPKNAQGYDAMRSKARASVIDGRVCQDPEAEAKGQVSIT